MEQTTIDTPEAELIDRAEIKDGQAIVAYNRTQAAVAALKTKYQGARYDLTTTAGDKAARAARLELVTLRTGLEKKRKELKAPAVDFGKRVDAEAARLTAEIVALENPIDEQIKADERRREEERRAREEAEAARRKVHTDAIAKIAGYVAQAADLTAERIAKGIEYLQGLDLSGFEEFKDEATATRDQSVKALQDLHAKAASREEEARRLEETRAEQARIAAEQAEAARKLQEQQAELQRQQAALAEQQAQMQREREAREAAERAQAEAAAQAERARQAAAEAAAAPAPVAPAPPLESAPQLQPVATAASAANEAPATTRTLTLGELKKLLTINGAEPPLSAAWLAALGFDHVGRERAALLFSAADVPAIFDAVSRAAQDAKAAFLQQQAAA